MKAVMDRALAQLLESFSESDAINVYIYPKRFSDFENIEELLGTLEGCIFTRVSGSERIELVATGSQIEQLALHSTVSRLELIGLSNNEAQSLGGGAEERYQYFMDGRYPEGLDRDLPEPDNETDDE